MGFGAGCLLGTDDELASLSSERVDAAIWRWTELSGALALPAFAFVCCSGADCQLWMH